MPYISEIAFTFLNLSRKILPPQHIGVNPFSDYPVAKKRQHYVSIANPFKIVNNWFCSHLFVDPLKFHEHMGIIACARFDIQEKCGQFERQNRGIPMIPLQLKTL